MGLCLLVVVVVAVLCLVRDSAAAGRLGGGGGTFIGDSVGLMVLLMAPTTRSSLGPLNCSITFLCFLITSFPINKSTHRLSITSAVTPVWICPLNSMSITTSPRILAFTFESANGTDLFNGMMNSLCLLATDVFM